MSQNQDNLKMKKNVSSFMLLSTVVLWSLLNLFFADRYIHIIRNQSALLELLFASVVVSWIVLTSFYATFHFISFTFSLYVRMRGSKISKNLDSVPPVAVFYTCMNDLKERSIIACLAQHYDNFDLYILDDSTELNERKKADDVQKKYSERVNVIRRTKRTGFKAGNLNNALKKISNKYTYVCLVDADEIIPPNFLQETVAIAEANSQIGFIQASHQQYSETEYGKQTGDGIDTHWNYFLPARNRFGFVYFYGHGALVRVQAIKSIGGFPELVSEDIALASKIRENGYRGHYAHDIKCLEESPPTYGAFRRKSRKVVSGTLEFLTKLYPSFFRSENVTLTEKIDLLIASSVIYLPIPFVFFLVLIHFILPIVGVHSEVGTAYSLAEVKGQYIRMTLAIFQPLWHFDSMVFIFFTVFASLLYLIPNFLRRPLRVVLYCFKTGTINLSVCLHTIVSTFTWVFNKRASFIPTGDRSQRVSLSFGNYFESLIGFLLVAAGIFTGSLCLIAVGISLALVPILIKNNLSGFWSRVSLLFPVLLTIIALCIVPILIVSMAGMFIGVALAQY